MSASGIPDGAPQFKCCPPIRGDDDRDALWAALSAGTIDIVVSDHSPAPPEVKLLDSGDVARAWGGIASIQFGLPAVWTHAVARGVDLATVLGWMSQGPADLVGLAHKGRIEIGADADLVALADREVFTVTPGIVRHRHPVTAYAGQELTGVVRRAWLRGRDCDPDVPAGRLLAATERGTR